jgi:hypothetical protein
MTRVVLAAFMFCAIVYGQNTSIRKDVLPSMPSGEVMLLHEACADDSGGIPSGYVMKFVRTGGYLGVCDAFWIYSDGRVINPLGKKAEISPEIIKGWIESIASTTPPSVGFESKSELCSDCFKNRVDIHDKDGSRNIRMFDPLPTESKDTALMSFIGMRDRLLRLKWK